MRICGKTFECVKTDGMSLSTICLSCFSLFISLFWMLASDDVLCSISRYHCGVLLFGSLLMIFALFSNIKNSYESLEIYNTIKISTFCLTIVYTIVLFALMCYKCGVCKKTKAPSKQFIKENTQRKQYSFPSNQNSIQETEGCTS